MFNESLKAYKIEQQQKDKAHATAMAEKEKLYNNRLNDAKNANDRLNQDLVDEKIKNEKKFHELSEKAEFKESLILEKNKVESALKSEKEKRIDAERKLQEKDAVIVGLNNKVSELQSEYNALKNRFSNHQSILTTTFKTLESFIQNDQTLPPQTTMQNQPQPPMQNPQQAGPIQKLRIVTVQRSQTGIPPQQYPTQQQSVRLPQIQQQQPFPGPAKINASHHEASRLPSLLPSNPRPQEVKS